MLPLNRSGLICACVLALGSSCMSEDGNGLIATQERSVAAFSRIEVQGGIQVTISQGPRRVTVTTDENLSSFYVTDVDGQTLKINETSNRLRPTGTVFVEVFTERLERLEVKNGAQVSADATQPDEFRLIVKDNSIVSVSRMRTQKMVVEASGESRVDAQGDVTELRIESRSRSAINTAGLDAIEVKVDASGQSLVNVSARSSIEVDASGDSVVNISGNPGSRNINSDSGSQVVFINE